MAAMSSHSPAEQRMDRFLASVELEKYQAMLADEGYETVADLRGISLDELVAAGVKRGHARRITNKLQDMHGERPPNAIDFGGLDRKEMEPEFRGPKKDVSLLLYGQTGVGKSTLLQSLGDFINGVPFEDISLTPKTAAKGCSQTMLSSLGTHNNREWHVKTIDTPGIGDTGGTVVDDDHMNNITDFLQNKEFNAVCILIKRGETRSVHFLRYVINELQTSMPKEVSQNFIIIMTRAELPIPDADTMAVIESLGLPIDNIIPINNIAYEEMDLSKYSPGSAAYESIISLQRTHYYENQRSLQRLLTLANGFAPYHGNNVIALKVKRNRLKEEVGLLMTRLDDTARMEITLQEQQVLLGRALKDERLARTAIMKTETITKKRYERGSGVIRTYCSACNVDCHMDCALGWSSDLTSCSCMNGSTCRVCHHSVTSHHHKGWTEISYKEQRTYEDSAKVAEMTTAQRNAAIIRGRQAQLDRERAQNMRVREEMVRSIQQMYADLEEIAIMGWNESYEGYMLECKRAIETDHDLAPAEKEQKLGIFERALAQIYVLKDAVGL